MYRVIYGMSFRRNVALEKLENLSKILNKHVIECVVYSQIRFDTVSHWVDEIATWMNAADEIKYKTRLKEKDYINSIFSHFGDSVLDAKVNLKEYKYINSKSREEKQYPDFDITDDMIHELFRCYQELIDVSLPILMSKDTLDTASWKSKLLPIFQ